MKPPLPARAVPGIDESIERCASNGERPVWAVENPIARKLKWPPAFASRVNEARQMLREGLPKREIIESHGSIVLRAAEEELNGIPYALDDDSAV